MSWTIQTVTITTA